MKSLNAQHHPLSAAARQVELLEDPAGPGPLFDGRLKQAGLGRLKSASFDTLQVNIGKMCNQTCTHCHVDAGPDRKERMDRATMEHCLRAVEAHGVRTVDLTGGAPEMHPEFRWFVEELRARSAHVMVRCNLTIILANKKYHGLPEFFRMHRVEVVSSLPFYTANRTDSQRGEGVFAKSIEALRMLNAVGYGADGSGLTLNLVYNPGGTLLPGPQEELERQFKKELRDRHGIVFNSLFAIANMPISRYLDYLVRTERYTAYMERLISAFNPAATMGVMCRSMISVGYDGGLYDCDFNQMLELPLSAGMPRHIRDLSDASVVGRAIVTGRHCYGCTAGAGSSCGGATA
ncbi:MAG: arsenosugar biosynthesis radical SAM protein ArsS [Flavobacteriales bacterium]|nr:arsenosugar biosynthesis radical SAM protein ArsS [Flavobacteriales bacterium]